MSPRRPQPDCVSLLALGTYNPMQLRLRRRLRTDLPLAAGEG